MIQMNLFVKQILTHRHRKQTCGCQGGGGGKTGNLRLADEDASYCISAATAKSLQSCLTLCDPTDGSPPGSAVPGILQARILEWVAISFSNAWKWKVKVKSLSRVQLSAISWTAAYQAPPSMGFSRQEYWSGVPLPSPFLRTFLRFLRFLRTFLRTWKNNKILLYCTVQFSSLTQSCPTLWDSMDCSTRGLPVHHQLPKSIESVMPSNHLILCHPLLLLPSIFLSIRVYT